MATVADLINPTADIYSTEYELDAKQQATLDDFNARCKLPWVLESMRADGLRWWRLSLAHKPNIFFDDFVIGPVTRAALDYERNGGR